MKWSIFFSMVYVSKIANAFSDGYHDGLLARRSASGRPILLANLQRRYVQSGISLYTRDLIPRSGYRPPSRADSSMKSLSITPTTTRSPTKSPGGSPRAGALGRLEPGSSIGSPRAERLGELEPGSPIGSPRAKMVAAPSTDSPGSGSPVESFPQPGVSKALIRLRGPGKMRAGITGQVAPLIRVGSDFTDTATAKHPTDAFGEAVTKEGGSLTAYATGDRVIGYAKTAQGGTAVINTISRGGGEQKILLADESERVNMAAGIRGEEVGVKIKTHGPATAEVMGYNHS